MKALERGDFFPLLVRSAPGKEDGIEQARWLVGHDSLSKQMWELRNMVCRSDESSIVNNGVIEPMMALVWVCTNVSLVHFLDEDRCEIVEQILSLFQNTCTVEVFNFVSATTAFSVDHIQREMAAAFIRHTIAGLQCLQPVSYDEHTIADHQFSANLQAALGARAVSQITILLKLDHPLTPAMDGAAARLFSVVSMAEKFNIHTGANQHICTILCNSCGERHFVSLGTQINCSCGSNSAPHIPEFFFGGDGGEWCETSCSR